MAINSASGVPSAKLSSINKVDAVPLMGRETNLGIDRNLFKARQESTLRLRLGRLEFVPILPLQTTP